MTETINLNGKTYEIIEHPEYHTPRNGFISLSNGDIIYYLQEIPQPPKLGIESFDEGMTRVAEPPKEECQNYAFIQWEDGDHYHDDSVKCGTLDWHNKPILCEECAEKLRGEKE